MMSLLEFKEKLKNIYAEHETYFRPVLKFLATFIVLVLIKYNVGYIEFLNMWPVILGISILLAFAPIGIADVGLGVIIVANVFSLSAELGLLLAAVIAVMLLVFFRFTPKQGAFLILAPMAFFLKIPYIIPIAAGLVCNPISIVSVSFGTIIYFILDIISRNAEAISIESNSSSIGYVINMITQDKEMMLTIVAFAVTIIVVYLIKRTSVNNSWTIAIVVGGVIEFIFILVGTIVLDTNNSLVWIIVGTLISVILAIILQFFVFSVDYSRTEHTQFEDDEYYYYVKAVPKINVTAPEMNVKRINAQRKRKKRQ